MATTKEILRFAVEMGDLMLRNGAEIYRVEDTVLYILKSHDIENCDVYVLSNGIFASANEDMEDACSVIRHVPLGAVHLGRLSALNQLTRDVCAHRLSIEEAWGRMAKSSSLPEYPLWLQVLMCGLGSAGFVLLFKGTLLDAAAGFAIGLLEQLLLYMCSRRKLSKFVQVLLAGGFVSFSASLLMALGLPLMEQAIVVGATMVVFPGIAFTTGIRDIYNGDYLSGTIHIFDSMLTAVCIAVGACLPQILDNVIVNIRR